MDFQGVFFSLLLAFTGAVILSPIFVQTHLHPSEILLDTVHCEVEWPKEYRHYYPIITSAVHYFLTLIIVLVLYTRIYIRLRSRYVIIYIQKAFERLFLGKTFEQICLVKTFEQICLVKTFERIFLGKKSKQDFEKMGFLQLHSITFTKHLEIP